MLSAVLRRFSVSEVGEYLLNRHPLHHCPKGDLALSMCAGSVCCLQKLVEKLAERHL